MNHEIRSPAKTLIKRRYAYILDLIAEFQREHGGDFPTARSPCSRAGESWYAIDGALRRDAIVQCLQFAALKSRLRQRGLTPTLARLNPLYVPPRKERREFVDILRLLQQSIEQNGGRFPQRTDPFRVLGHRDTWIAIDSALLEGAVADCPLWTAHRCKMEELGVPPSLASLNPLYHPRRRALRSTTTILAATVTYMAENGGRTPSQRSRFPMKLPYDSWKAICKALRTGAVLHDTNWGEFNGRLALSGHKPSLHTLLVYYREELLRTCAATAPLSGGTEAALPSPPQKQHRALKKTSRFAGLISQLFHTPSTADTKARGAPKGRRLS